MKLSRWIWVTVCVLVACSSLPYKDDVGFLISAQAGSDEFPVYVNGHLCTDLEGHPGLCSKRITSTEDVVFEFDAQPYPYLLTINCPTGIPVAPATVPQNQKYSFTLPHTAFASFRTFICIGEISPQDRTPPVSARFDVHISILDSKYVQREQIYLHQQSGNNFLVLGQYARSAWVYDNKEWKQYSKTTEVQLRGDPMKAKAYTESFASRFNYFQMGDVDRPIP